MKQTKAESALRQARKDLNDLEKKHNEMRRKYEKESKRKVLYRSYRIGELPDTKLKYKDLIDPLLNLFIFDNKI